MTPYADATQAEVFAFLDALRAGGTLNMLGAGRVLTQQYGVTPYVAKQMLRDWMTAQEAK